MKKFVTLLLCFLMVAPMMTFAADSVTVEVPGYNVFVNGQQIDNENSQYPVIKYKGITYFPMTADYLKAIGLSLKFGDTGLDLNKVEGITSFPKLQQGFLGGDNKLGSKHKAYLPSFDVRVNGQLVVNSSEQYPVLSFRNITYFPMTWRFAVEEFGWKTKWDPEVGFEISTFDALDLSKEDLIEVSTKVVDGKQVDNINFGFVFDERIVGNWQTVGFLDDIDGYRGYKEDYKIDQYMQELAFYKNGETSNAWKWTKGLLLHDGDSTASRYIIKNINSRDHLFMEWKSGDYTIRHDQPSWYIYIRKEMKEETASIDGKPVKITKLDKENELIELTNDSKEDINIGGWMVKSVTGGQFFIIPTYVIKAGESITIGDSLKNPEVTFHWLEGRGVWNNSERDDARLYDERKQLMFEYLDN